LIGKPVTVTSSQLSVAERQRRRQLQYNGRRRVGISVYNSAGVQVQTATVNSAAGANTWKWDGKSATGATMPDVHNKVSVVALGVSGSAAQIPFYRDRHGDIRVEQRRHSAGPDGRVDTTLQCHQFAGS